MKTPEARALGKRVAALVHAGQTEAAYAALAPTLSERTPFRLLGIVGETVGRGPLAPVNAFVERVAADATEGGWVVIGTALGAQLDRDLAGAFARCHRYVRAADVWYGADIFGERVPGPALVADFEPALALLKPWRSDANVWIRRTVGVAVHFWAKRSDGAAEQRNQAQALLDFLAPMFEAWEMSVVKGVGWGLKTLGKYYPDLVTPWLRVQVVERERRHRAAMTNKATAYLSDEQRARAMGTVIS